MPEYLAPGVFVEETSFRSKSIQGVGTSTTAFVGPSRKGPLGEVSDVLTSFGEFERLYGGVRNLRYHGEAAENMNYLAHAVQAYFNNGGARLYFARTFTAVAAQSFTASSNSLTNGTGDTATFVARWPGAGLNGLVTAFEKRSPASERTLDTTPVGSLALAGAGNPAQSAMLTGGPTPIALTEDDRLGLVVNGANQTARFQQRTSAEAVGDAITLPVDVPADTTLTVTIDGEVQAVTLDVNATTDGQSLLDQVNAGLRDGYARLEGGNQLVIGSDSAGAEASVSVAQVAVLGFTAADTPGTGSGNVADIGAVTAAEIGALLDGVVGTTATDGTLNLSADPTESVPVATLEVRTTGVTQNARASFNFVANSATGAAGTTPTLFHKTASGWVDTGNNPVADLPTDTELVQLNLTVADADGTLLLYEGLGFFPGHPRYLGDALPQEPLTRSASLAHPVFYQADSGFAGFDLYAALFTGGDRVELAMTGGGDGGAPVGSDADPAEGAISYADALVFLEDVDDVSIVAAPGHSSLADVTFRAVQNALISHAERERYRIAVLDTPADQTPGDARQVRSRIDSSYAAVYYPWVMVPNPLARPGDETIPTEVALPPSGFVCGIYARNDIQRGVWKAPANEVVRGALRFEREINKGHQEVLNPEGVNCLRSFSGRGNRIWGARTASSDPEWMYVNVRRYFIYLEHSIDRSTQWAVFEPNGERLWANIRDTVSAFLFNEWRSGALLGTSPDQAYFVRCDRSTMTQADLDNGRLICEIGVAVLKPAEFVIFRIGQKTADAQ